jgi:transposase
LGRELNALGHRVKLIPPGYVKAYVKRNKNDVPHRARGLLVRQRTMLVNALRAHMAEFGIIAP